MKQQRQSHLDVSDRHRDFAYSQHPLSGYDAWREWAIVGAFYSAVHSINAYLWETYSFAPQNHEDRTRAVHRFAALSSTGACYDRLRNWAYSARYQPTFRASDALLEQALNCLEEIRSLVLSHIT